MLLKILRSINNPRSKTKSKRNDQSISKSSIIFEGEYIYYFLKIDNST